MKYVIAETRGVDYYWIVEAEDKREAIETCSFKTEDAAMVGVESWTDDGECQGEDTPDGRDLIAMIENSRVG